MHEARGRFDRHRLLEVDRARAVLRDRTDPAVLATEFPRIGAHLLARDSEIEPAYRHHRRGFDEAHADAMFSHFTRWDRHGSTGRYKKERSESDEENPSPRRARHALDIIQVLGTFS